MKRHSDLTGWRWFLEWCSDADRYPQIPWVNHRGMMVTRKGVYPYEG